MLTIDYIVHFKESLPSREEIQNAVAQRMGLEVELKEHTISCSRFSMVLDFEYEDSAVVFSTVVEKMYYFLGAILWTLKDMGGEVEGEAQFSEVIPSWAKLPWKEARLHPDMIC